MKAILLFTVLFGTLVNNSHAQEFEQSDAEFMSKKFCNLMRKRTFSSSYGVYFHREKLPKSFDSDLPDKMDKLIFENCKSGNGRGIREFSHGNLSISYKNFLGDVRDIWEDECGKLKKDKDIRRCIDFYNSFESLNFSYEEGLFEGLLEKLKIESELRKIKSQLENTSQDCSTEINNSSRGSVKTNNSNSIINRVKSTSTSQ